MRIRSIITITAIGGLLFLTGVALAGPASGLEIARHIIGGGGAHSKTATYGVDFTIGQPLVGTRSSGDTRLCAGFWAMGGGDGELGRDIFLPLVLRHG